MKNLTIEITDKVKDVLKNINYLGDQKILHDSRKADEGWDEDYGGSYYFVVDIEQEATALRINYYQDSYGEVKLTGVQFVSKKPKTITVYEYE